MGALSPGLLTTGLLVVATLTLDDVLFHEFFQPGGERFRRFYVCSGRHGGFAWSFRAMRLAQAAAIEAADAARAAKARGAGRRRDRLDLILRDLPVGVVIATEQGKVELSVPPPGDPWRSSSAGRRSAAQPAHVDPVGGEVFAARSRKLADRTFPSQRRNRCERKSRRCLCRMGR